MTRLRRGQQLPADVAAPPLEPDGVGIVHLGIGAFHRAHQATFTEDAAAATKDRRWGILGVTQRSSRVVGQLRPQGGWYSVLTRGVGQTSIRVVASVLDAAFPGTETPRILAAIAAASTHVVTLTVTEKGYCRDASGRLDAEAVAADLRALAQEEGPGAGAEPASATTAIGLLTRGLALRRRRGGAPITVLTCDNMTENGAVLASLVDQAVDAALPGAAGADLREWLAGSVTFPCSMVDRIVPAATAADRDEAEHMLGARDEGLVVAEPFRQWVIEDRFAGPRPAWELAGAVLTADVAAYERAKLRLLNGTHSLLAYAGALAGHRTIAAAVADPQIRARARTFLFEDALPTLSGPAELDLHGYGEQILERFANPALGHATTQVAMDGSQKIPYRWGETIAERLDSGAMPHGAAYAVAAWVVFVARGADLDGTSLEVDDPAAVSLAAAVDRARTQAGGSGRLGDRLQPGEALAVVRALLGVGGVFPERVAGDAGFAEAVAAEVTDLLT